MKAYDEKYESNILTLMINSEKALLYSLSNIDETDFYNENYRGIFNIIKRIHNQSKEVTFINIYEECKKNEIQEMVKAINGEIVSFSELKELVRIIKLYTFKRSILKAGLMVQEAAELSDQEEISQEIENVLYKAIKKEEVLKYSTMQDVCDQTFKQIEDVAKGIIGIETGFKSVDNIIDWMDGGDLVVIAARPSIGKTAFQLALASNIASRGQAVGIFSLEMMGRQIGRRLLSTRTGINMKRIKRAELTPDEVMSLSEQQAVINKLPIFIDDANKAQVGKLCSKMRLMKRRHNIKIFFIDHLGYVNSDEKRTENRNREVAYITKSIKALAKELDIPIVLLSQLSRANKDRKEKRPVMSDLRDSGDIEQDADCIMMLHREDYYNPECERPNILEVWVRKGRDSGDGYAELFYDRTKQQISEIPKHLSNIGNKEF